MASCVSPTVVDLSSDSEPNPDENLPDNASQAADDVFILDWAAKDYPTSADDIIDLYNELGNADRENASTSSGDTEIYTSHVNEQITWNDTLEKECSSQTLSEIDKAARNGAEKLVKEQTKLEKKRLREEKKAEKLKQKQMKAAAAQKHRNLKPEENIKLLVINIDTQLINSEFGGVLINSLQEAGIQYSVGDQIKPFTISWSKKIKDIIVSELCIAQEDAGVREEEQLLYVIDSNKMVKLVHSNELLTHIQTIKSVYHDKYLTLVITGMENYFHMQKKKLTKGSTNFPFLNVSKEELQSALIELQLIGNCNHCMIDSREEFALLVVSTTKSLSQLDYKTEKHQREEGELDWFAKGDSRSCVKVDKNGNGLIKLWQQQMCQFNAVGVEIANAIISKYHSPQNLMEAYKKCSSIKEGELLLQNIQIRRDAGILSSTRRIGPEASKKIYHFYMSDDPDLEL